jgi:hypothetical protein
LSFETYSSPEPCGTSNITLNGVYLPQEWNGNSASGSGSFAGVANVQKNAWFLQHNLDLEWETVCLETNEPGSVSSNSDTAQVLTLTIKAVDGKPLDKPAGFTLSYTQVSPLELLRLELVPNSSAGDKVNAEAWRNPPSHLRLTKPAPPPHHLPLGNTPGQALLESDLEDLKVLEAQAQELQKAIEQKKKHIDNQLDKEGKGFKKEPHQCDSIACVAKTIAEKAHTAWRLLYVRLRLIEPRPYQSKMGASREPYARVFRPGGPHGKIAEAAIKIDSMPPPATSDGLPPSPPPPPSPPLPPSPPPPPFPPHQGTGQGHNQEPPSLLALQVILGVLCCGCLITVIRSRCSSLRTRTERAAAREERRNARAYWRAARTHAWRNWWHRNWRDQERIDDYEEKRSLIRDQESILEEAMQEEIRQLRDAHGMVNSLIQAEEGRIQTRCGGHMRCHCCHQPTPPSPASSVYTSNSLAELPSRPLSRTSSLPSYRSDESRDPPAYEEDEDVSEVVTSGFVGYIPSSASADSRWTPDSSVVDVSPRPSADTLRYTEYAETTDTGVGDAKY